MRYETSPVEAGGLPGTFRRATAADTARGATKMLLGKAGLSLARRLKWSLMCRWNGWGVVKKPMDPRWLEVLTDPDFKASMGEVRDISSLDTARLANLWMWCGMSEPGAMVEVGAFRGGTSLHLSNRWPSRKIFVCDTFEGFASLRLDETLDTGIRRGSWCNPDAAAVSRMFAERRRDAVVLAGVFPESDHDGRIEDVSFAHIDVDIHDSCRNSLEYLSARATPGALFAVNDYLRETTRGVARAVAEFLSLHADWMAIPAFPGQALMVRRSELERRTDR
jgi:O-methyltransferase